MTKVLKKIIEKSVLGKHRKAWKNRNDCVLALTLGPKIIMARTKRLLKHKANKVRVTKGVIRDNCTVGINLIK